MTDLSDARAPGFFRRLAVIVYELLLLAGVVFVAASIYTLLVQGLTGADLTQGLARLAFRLYLLAIVLGYYLYFWTQGRQSLAMRTWRMALLRTDGSTLRPRDALLRIGFAILTLAPLGLGLWWMLFDRDRQTWYDRLAGTRAVMLRADATTRHRSKEAR
jgi:uncharacterized RDD family membrane protein YckC